MSPAQRCTKLLANQTASQPAWERLSRLCTVSALISTCPRQLSCPPRAESHLVHLQFSALLVRVRIIWVPRTRKPRATLPFQLDLNASNGRFRREVYDNFARQEVQVCEVGVPTVQHDCRGHGDERPELEFGPPPMGFAWGRIGRMKRTKGLRQSPVLFLKRVGQRKGFRVSAGISGESKNADQMREGSRGDVLSARRSTIWLVNQHQHEHELYSFCAQPRSSSGYKELVLDGRKWSVSWLMSST